MAEQVANNWNAAGQQPDIDWNQIFDVPPQTPPPPPPPEPPVLQRELFPPMEMEEPQIYSFYMPRNYSRNERTLAISLPNVAGEIFVLVVPEGVGSGDQIFFPLPAEHNGIIQKEMITRIDHCQ
ncbi:uncharacterized protein METZ01_LOCUS390001 [marine metagenome]|uniref:Uncharacterized protein n=1 Tax=marine metagenome TaxID=408172 RepID=A0A382USM7_9ZZZZ